MATWQQIETATPEFAQNVRPKVDICDVARTYVGTPADHLVIESWH